MAGKNYHFKNDTSEYFIDGFSDNNFDVHVNNTLILYIDENLQYHINIRDKYIYKNRLYCLSFVDMILEKKYCIFVIDNTLNIFDISIIEYEHPGLYDWIYKICYFEKYLQYENILLVHIDDIHICYSLDTLSQYNNTIFNILAHKINNFINWIYSSSK